MVDPVSRSIGDQELRSVPIDASLQLLEFFYTLTAELGLVQVVAVSDEFLFSFREMGCRREVKIALHPQEVVWLCGCAAV